MVLLGGTTIFSSGPAVSGSKNSGAHCWKYCPYSTQISNYNGDTRIPEGDKTFHSETNGWMHTYNLGGAIGWVCADNDCSFYTGTFAVTVSGWEVPQHGRRFQYTSGNCPKTDSDFATISGSVANLTKGRVLISGTRYYEI